MQLIWHWIPLTTTRCLMVTWGQVEEFQKRQSTWKERLLSTLSLSTEVCITVITSQHIFKETSCITALVSYHNDILGSYLGSLTITDGNHTTLLNDSFQQVNPTIVLPHPVLTNRIKMTFSYEIYISEIEVFGGKPVFCINICVKCKYCVLE